MKFEEGNTLATQGSSARLDKALRLPDSIEKLRSAKRFQEFSVMDKIYELGQDG